jgi:hypothetical protein
MKLTMYLHPNIFRDDDPVIATLEDYGFKTLPRLWAESNGIFNYVFIDADNPPTIEIETLDDLVRMHERVQLPIQLDFSDNTLVFVSSSDEEY